MSNCNVHLYDDNVQVYVTCPIGRMLDLLDIRNVVLSHVRKWPRNNDLSLIVINKISSSIHNLPKQQVVYLGITKSRHFQSCGEIIWSTIINKQYLSSTQKSHHLKTLLVDEVANLVLHLAITEKLSSTHC